MATTKKCYANPVFVLIFAFFCSQGFKSSSVAAISTIRVGDELNSTWNMVSENGQFTLGFFLIEDTNSSYLGTWYTNDDQERKVWVANPNAPITGSSGALMIDNNGTLKIILGESTFLNLFVQNGAGDPTATLGDSGNFVLMDEVGRTLWESFDHPTNTLLPGTKLGYNLTSGRNWTLNSWITDSIPASGHFNLSLESYEESVHLVIHRRRQRYWTSGAWVDNEGFKSFPELNQSSNMYHYTLSYVSDRDGNSKYFTYYPIESNPNPMLQLSANGQIYDVTNSRPISPLFCYGYGREDDRGCVDTTVLGCRTKNDSFVLEKAVYLPSQMSSSDQNASLLLSDCFEMCWNDCSCVAFDTYYDNGTGCTMWYEYPTRNPQTDTSQVPTKYVLVSTNSSQGETKSSKSKST